MPDYEIRLFHPDGSLAVVHITHHETDAEAHALANNLKGKDYAHYEIHREGAVLGEA